MRSYETDNILYRALKSNFIAMEKEFKYRKKQAEELKQENKELKNELAKLKGQAEKHRNALEEVMLQTAPCGNACVYKNFITNMIARALEASE